MSDEFSIDIDKALENAKTTDLAGGFVDYYPTGVESVKHAVTNCIDLAGLDKKMVNILHMIVMIVRVDTIQRL